MRERRNNHEKETRTESARCPLYHRYRRRHREYDIINTRYVVEGRFAEATLTEKDKTLSDAMEDIISDEFTDLTAKKEEPKMKPKPVRSTAGKER